MEMVIQITKEKNGLDYNKFCSWLYGEPEIFLILQKYTVFFVSANKTVFLQKKNRFFDLSVFHFANFCPSLFFCP